MAVLRAVARPMLASIFVVQGYQTWRWPERVAARAEPVVRPVTDRVAVLPDETEQAVRLNGAVQCVAGSMLAMGWLPRLSAAVLAGTLVPTTLAGHRFWEVEDKQERAQQRIHFLKNLTMLGGLLIAAADTGGNPSLAWRRALARGPGRGRAVPVPPIGTKAAFSDIARTKRISNRLCARATSILLIYHRGRQSALKIL